MDRVAALPRNFLRFLYPHLNNGFVTDFADAYLVSRAYPQS